MSQKMFLECPSSSPSSSDSESQDSSCNSTNYANKASPSQFDKNSVTSQKIPVPTKLSNTSDIAEQSHIKILGFQTLKIDSSESTDGDSPMSKQSNNFPRRPSKFYLQSVQATSALPAASEDTSQSKSQRASRSFLPTEYINLSFDKPSQLGSHPRDRSHSNHKPTDQSSDESTAKTSDKLPGKLNFQGTEVNNSRSQLILTEKFRADTETPNFAQKQTKLSNQCSEDDCTRPLIFSPTVKKGQSQKYFDELLKGLTYSLNKLRNPSQQYIESKKLFLEDQVHIKRQSSPKKTLVLDLDETLVHLCTVRQVPDKIAVCGEPNAHSIPLLVRPYVGQFLKTMAKYFEIVIFTAGTEAYANAVIKELDPKNAYISHVLDRRYCMKTNSGFYIKDLRMFGNRELKNMVIVDNLVHSFGFQLDNGIPILEWTGDKNDCELKYLARYLVELAGCDDIPALNAKRLKLVEMSRMTLDDLVRFQTC